MTLLLAAAALAQPISSSTLREGDVVLQRSSSGQSAAIAAATGSQWTHTGLVRLVDGTSMVLEAVQPVRLTPLDDWIARGVEGRFAVVRYTEPVWTEPAIARLDELQQRWLGRPYDPHFELGDEALYCSELVWLAYAQAAGVPPTQLRPISDYAVDDPQVRAQMLQRWGAIPLDQLVVAPSDLATAPNMIPVPWRPAGE